MSKSTKLTCEQRLFITWYLKVCFVGVGEGSLSNIVGNPRLITLLYSTLIVCYRRWLCGTTQVTTVGKIIMMIFKFIKYENRDFLNYTQQK